MVVKELIAYLERCNPEAPVYLRHPDGDERYPAEGRSLKFHHLRPLEPAQTLTNVTLVVDA